MGNILRLGDHVRITPSGLAVVSKVIGTTNVEACFSSNREISDLVLIHAKDVVVRTGKPVIGPTPEKKQFKIVV